MTTAQCTLTSRACLFRRPQCGLCRAVKAGGTSGARTMQEFKYIRDGATLVISVDGLNWLSKRRCSDKVIKQRNEELRLLISSGQMTQAEAELQPITCFYILDQKGSADPRLWSNSGCRSSLVSWVPSFSPQQCCLPEEPTHHSANTSLTSVVSQCPKKAQRTRLILNMQDIFNFIKQDFNIVMQQNTVRKNQHNSFIIFSHEDIPLQLLGDTCDTEGCRTSVGDSGWHYSDLKNATALWPHGPSSCSSRRTQHELVSRDDFNARNHECLLKCCQISDAPGVLSPRDKNVKKRKSVSFDDDVMVYLFDQESPTLELHSGPCTSVPSGPPEVTLDDSGLEWEDDFSALEKSCHIECVRQSVSQHYTLPLPTQSCSPLSRRFFLPQNCLFLTHVTETDLEL